MASTGCLARPAPGGSFLGDKPSACPRENKTVRKAGMMRTTTTAQTVASRLTDAGIGPDRVLLAGTEFREATALWNTEVESVPAVYQVWSVAYKSRRPAVLTQYAR